MGVGGIWVGAPSVAGAVLTTAIWAGSVGGMFVGATVAVERAMLLGGRGTTAECSASTIALSTRQLWIANTTAATVSSTRSPAANFRRRLLRKPKRDEGVVGIAIEHVHPW